MFFIIIFFLFFFFQAEDGIRDTSVTGVQTCALPISRVVRPGPRVGVHGKRRGGAARGALPPGPTGGPAVPAAPAATASHLSRIRERRALSDQRLPEGPVTSVRLLEDASRRLTHARGALRRLLPRRPAASGAELSPLDGDGTDAPRHPRPRPGAPH